MNILRLVTRPTDDPNVFDTYWMTGLVQKGRVRTTVFLSDCLEIAAELSALQHLLEVKNVCGHDKSGAGLRIWVSYDEIVALMNESSGKFYLSAYANFLRTRFYGADVIVDSESVDWADQLCEQQVDEISVYTPALTTIELAGIGVIELTAHAVKRYVERFERPKVKAWRDLVKLAKEAVHVTPDRNVIHDLQHRHEGVYFLAKQVMLVVTLPDHPKGMPRLVSVTLPDMSNIGLV